MRAVAVLAILVVGIPSSGFAFCMEPSVSRANLSLTPPSRPVVPYCLSAYKYSGKHSCEEWEVEDYRMSVKAFMSRLSQYVEEAYGFAKKAEDYAKCEAGEVAAQHR